MSLCKAKRSAATRRCQTKAVDQVFQDCKQLLVFVFVLYAWTATVIHETKRQDHCVDLPFNDCAVQDIIAVASNAVFDLKDC